MTDWMTDWLKEWVSRLTSGGVNEWLSQSKNEQVSQSVNTETRNRHKASRSLNIDKQGTGLVKGVSITKNRPITPSLLSSSNGSEWVSEWVKTWIQMSEWVDKEIGQFPLFAHLFLSEWVSGWMNRERERQGIGYVCEYIKKSRQTLLLYPPFFFFLSEWASKWGGQMSKKRQNTGKLMGESTPDKRQAVVGE